MLALGSPAHSGQRRPGLDRMLIMPRTAGVPGFEVSPCRIAGPEPGGTGNSQAA